MGRKATFSEDAGAKQSVWPRIQELEAVVAERTRQRDDALRLLSEINVYAFVTTWKSSEQVKAICDALKRAGY